MDFGLTEEQRMIVDTTRAFVEAELYPHEQRSSGPACCRWN
jgi:acyl-CoA dehydrogenase